MTILDSKLGNNISSISLEDEMKRSYLDYAMSVIVSRALPDVRDGLKPVHRRVLFSMYEGGYFSNKPHRKSARIVGDVIGKYHPHGDVAVYDSLVRMAQDFSLRTPLVDGQGNFGSIDGDSPAAMRYTESRLSKIAHTLLSDIDKETVDFAENYDGSEEEPRVLPASFPNLLVNGSGGIAVGMATSIPPHNLGEVIEACLAYVDNNDIEILELLEYVKGPDFPTGGMIIGMNGIKSSYLTGRGSIIMRGRTEIEAVGTNKQAVIITDVPYMVNKAKLVEKIADLVREKKIEGISDLRDESNKDGIRVVVELKRDAVAEVVRSQLYSYTPLQTNFSSNMLALDGGMPKLMNLKDIIANFIDFREVVITKRTIYLLNKARDKSHILVGLRVAIDNIDEIIKIIKGARDPNHAKEQLISKIWQVQEIVEFIKLVDDRAIITENNQCKLTETQAKAILEMRLQRLTSMEKDKIEAELKALSEEISVYMDILNSRPKLLAVLKEELIEIKNEFASPRLTSIEFDEFESDEEDLIQREEMVVTVTLGGYIKRVPLATYRLQRRGGKGRSGLSMKDEDVTTQIFVGSTHTQMLFFSNKGQVYSLKLYKLPLCTPQSKGRSIVNLLPLAEGEIITNIMPVPEHENELGKLSIMFATAKGNIRRSDFSDFKNIPSRGKIAIRFDDADDSLIGVSLCTEADHILLATKEGQAIRFPVDTLRIFKSRSSDGVKAMKLSDTDRVISMTILNGIKATMEEREAFLSIALERRIAIASGEDFILEELNTTLDKDKVIALAQAEQFILTVSENGYGKRTSAYEQRITARGGKGINNMNLSDKTGNVVAVMPANSSTELMLITNSGRLIRVSLTYVRITGRNTTGVILCKTDGEKVVSVSLIAEQTEQDDENLESDN